VLNLTDTSNLDVTLTLPSLIGFSAALISGLISLYLLNYVLNRKNLLPFAIYTYLLGSFLLGLSL
jgi:undecaprenyl pyrophosphate phosphatase UppP